MAKEYLYRGKTIDELKAMDIDTFAKLVPSRERRKIKRGFTDVEKKLIETLKQKNSAKTHCRDMIVLPQMVGKTIKIHSGKEWVTVDIMPEMIAHRLGELALTRRMVKHSAPGIGATRSSAALSVR